MSPLVTVSSFIDWWASTFAKPDSYVALFTGLLFISTCLLWWTTKRTVDIARREFTASHRPRIIVRYIEWGGYNDEAQEVAFVHIVNVGVSDATIEEFGADLAKRDTKESTIERFRLISGQRHTFDVPAKAAYTEQDIAADAMDSIELCVFGAIRYSDGNGVARETGFFRVLDTKSEKFISSKDKGEEYQD
jgi:hypothetical protein